MNIDNNIRKTSSLFQYIKRHTQNIHEKSPGSVYDFNTLSITVLEFYKDNLFYLKDIIYMPLDDCYKKYILEGCNKYPAPYDHLNVIYLDILKDRIILKTDYKKIDNKDRDIKECFNKFCEEKCDSDDLTYLENLMHVDDHLLSDWFVESDSNLREKALSLIRDSNQGSWLVRRSSITEQPNVKIRVITFKTSSSEIKHLLFAQIDGFGYVLTHGFSGDSFPKIGDNNPIVISHVFRSLPSLLKHMKNYGLLMDRIIQN